MQAYIYMNTRHTYTHIHIYNVSISIYLSIYLYICTYICTPVCNISHAYICTPVCIYRTRQGVADRVRVCMFVWACMCVGVCVCVCVCVRHTHICWRMLTYADVCRRMSVRSRCPLQLYADRMQITRGEELSRREYRQLRMLTYADVCRRMPTYADNTGRRAVAARVQAAEDDFSWSPQDDSYGHLYYCSVYGVCATYSPLLLPRNPPQVCI
jgi:hypothetical protein